MDQSRTEALKSLLTSANLTLRAVIFSSSRSCVLIVEDDLGESLILKVRPSPGLNLDYENSVLSALSHPNIVKTKGFISNQDFSGLLLEKVKGTPLIDLLKTRGSFSDAELKNMFRQLVSALMYLESKEYVHLDLKPDNIIYDEETQHVTLIDFETVFKFSETPKFNKPVGTLEYSAPEVHRGKRYGGREAQIWSLGVTLFVAKTGIFPEFQKVAKKSSKRWLLLRRKRKEYEIKFPSTVSPEAQDLFKKLLQTEARNRSTLAQLNVCNWSG